MKDLEIMELKISHFLRWGVIISGLMIGTGWLWNLDLQSNIFPHYTEYDPIPLQNFLTYHFNQGNYSQLLSYAGLLFLITLPVIRVFLTGILFLRQKDYHLAIIAAFVLVGLLISFSFGLFH